MSQAVPLHSNLMPTTLHLRRLFRIGFLVEVLHFRATFFISCAGFVRGNFFLILGISALRNRPQAVTFLLTFFFTIMSASFTGSEYAIWSALVSEIPPANKRPRIIAQVGQDMFHHCCESARAIAAFSVSVSTVHSRIIVQYKSPSQEVFAAPPK